MYCTSIQVLHESTSWLGSTSSDVHGARNSRSIASRGMTAPGPRALKPTRGPPRSLETLPQGSGHHEAVPGLARWTSLLQRSQVLQKFQFESCLAPRCEFPSQSVWESGEASINAPGVDISRIAYHRKSLASSKSNSKTLFQTNPSWFVPWSSIRLAGFEMED